MEGYTTAAHRGKHAKHAAAPKKHAAPHKGTKGSHSHESPIYRSQATLQAFDSGSYTATITLLKSPDQAIVGVPVSRAIPSANLTVGSTLAVIFYDSHNSADAMVVGVH